MLHPHANSEPDTMYFMGIIPMLSPVPYAAGRVFQPVQAAVSSKEKTQGRHRRLRKKVTITPHYYIMHALA